MPRLLLTVTTHQNFNTTGHTHYLYVVSAFLELDCRSNESKLYVFVIHGNILVSLLQTFALVVRGNGS